MLHTITHRTLLTFSLAKGPSLSSIVGQETDSSIQNFQDIINSLPGDFLVSLHLRCLLQQLNLLFQIAKHTLMLQEDLRDLAHRWHYYLFIARQSHLALTQMQLGVGFKLLRVRLE